MRPLRGSAEQPANNDTCMNAMTRYDIGDDRCRANNLCGGSEFLGNGGAYGRNSCYTLPECLDRNGGRSAPGDDGMCIAADEGTCFNAGAATYFLQGGRCKRTCSGTNRLKRSVGSMNACVSETDCRDTRMGAVMGSNCVAGNGTGLL